MRELMEYIEQWKQEQAASIIGRIDTEIDTLTEAVIRSEERGEEERDGE